MKYLITDTSIIRLSESAGVIQNLGNDKIELSDSQNFTDSIVLPMLNKFSFDRQLYIRAATSKVDNFIEVNVVPFAIDGGSGGSSSSSEPQTVDEGDVATDDDADNLLDDIFGDSSELDDNSTLTADNVDDYFDSIFGSSG